MALVAATPGFLPQGDPADYDRHAVYLEHAGHYPPSQEVRGSPTAFRPPAYPYVLAGTYAVTGKRWSAGRLLGAALGALAVLLLYLAVAEAWGRRAALVAAGAAAAFPPLVVLSGSLLSESLFLPLELGALVAVLRFRRDQRLAWAALAGALCGAAALTRTAGILLLVPVAVGVLAAAPGPWRARLRGRALVPAVAALAAAVVVVAPWTIRNERAFHAFVPISTQDGFVLAGTWNEEAARHDDFEAVPRVPRDVETLRPAFLALGSDEAEVGADLRGRALDFAAAHPGYVAKAFALNALRMFQLGPHEFTTTVYEDEAAVPAVLRPVGRAATLAMVVLALVALVRIARRRLWLSLGPAFVWLFPVTMLLAAAPILASPRYRAPVDPFLLALIALAFTGRQPAGGP